MSLIIKGMKLPEKCDNCPCYDYIDYVCRADDCFAPFDVENSEERSEHCPLIEIRTPHGRLIDADAFETKLKHLAMSEEPYQRGLVKAFLSVISCEPIIIEAEESE